MRHSLKEYHYFFFTLLTTTPVIWRNEIVLQNKRIVPTFGAFKVQSRVTLPALNIYHARKKVQNHAKGFFFSSRDIRNIGPSLQTYPNIAMVKVIDKLGKEMKPKFWAEATESWGVTFGKIAYMPLLLKRASHKKEKQSTLEISSSLSSELLGRQWHK